MRINVKGFSVQAGFSQTCDDQGFDVKLPGAEDLMP